MERIVFQSQNSSTFQHVSITYAGGVYTVDYMSRSGHWQVECFREYGPAFICAREALESYEAGMSQDDEIFQEIEEDIQALYAA